MFFLMLFVAGWLRQGFCYGAKYVMQDAVITNGLQTAHSDSCLECFFYLWENNQGEEQVE